MCVWLLTNKDMSIAVCRSWSCNASATLKLIHQTNEAESHTKSKLRLDEPLQWRLPFHFMYNFNQTVCQKGPKTVWWLFKNRCVQYVEFHRIWWLFKNRGVQYVEFYRIWNPNTCMCTENSYTKISRVRSESLGRTK